MIKLNGGFKEENFFDHHYFLPDDVDYEKIIVEHITDTHYYRDNFVGKGFTTLIKSTGHFLEYWKNMVQFLFHTERKIKRLNKRVTVNIHIGS
jgi:hypothetical protein